MGGGELGGRVGEASPVISGLRLPVDWIDKKTDWKGCGRSWGRARGDRRVDVMRNDR